MPIYNFKCKVCKKVLEDELTVSWEQIPTCCNQPMIRLFPVPTIDNKRRVGGTIFPIGGVTIQHVEANPVHFNSRQELKNYEKEHNVEIGG